MSRRPADVRHPALARPALTPLAHTAETCTNAGRQRGARDAWAGAGCGRRPGAGKDGGTISMSSGDGLAQIARAQAQSAGPPLSQAAYRPGVAYDEMFDRDGSARAHYEVLRNRIETLGADELEDRQQTLERSFLLQGITFTVYGAESSTERIIPTDLFPRILP